MKRKARLDAALLLETQARRFRQAADVQIVLAEAGRGRTANGGISTLRASADEYVTEMMIVVSEIREGIPE